MNDNSKLSRTSLNRDDKGKFSQSDYGEKHTHSIRLSDEAWELLETKGIANNVTRTEMIEQLARGLNEQAIIMSALRRFIDNAKGDYGTNPAQKGKPFSTGTRDWSQFIKFLKLVENAPWELGIDEE